MNIQNDDDNAALHFFSHEPGDFSPRNMLVMVAEELGLVVECGFQRNQYILKKRVPPTGYDTHIKTLYCSARNNGDTISFTGAIEQTNAVALVDPKFFDKLREMLGTDDFFLPSSKRFDLPLCDNPRL